MEKGEDGLTYACEDCGFLFCRMGAVKDCPYCEKNNIRLATEEETGIIQKLLEQGKSFLRLKEEQTL